MEISVQKVFTRSNEYPDLHYCMQGHKSELNGVMHHITSDYTCYGVELAYDISFNGLVNLMVSKLSLQTNQSRLSFQCIKMNFVMQIINVITSNIL